MKPKIIATNREHLKSLIENEMLLNGSKCDLNHIDVSNLTDIRAMFYQTDFNGDISQWDVSKIEEMFALFAQSEFNGDISKWNVSNVVNMNGIFSNSKFSGDVSKWKPLKLHDLNEHFFENCPAPVPYWAKAEDLEHMLKLIENYSFKEEIDKELPNNNSFKKKAKI